MNTEEKKLEIIRLYSLGYNYEEIRAELKTSNNLIGECVRGSRSPSQANMLARSKGRGILTENGRLSLSENGKRLVRKNRKFWTKPEREFKEILFELGLTVRFPEYVEEICGVISDPNGRIYYQYPIQRYVCDYVDVENRVVYRVNGDFWHANPILYDHNKLTRIQIHNLRQDKNCKIFLTKNGWTVCDMWESEIYWNKELVKQRVTSLTQSKKEYFEIQDDHLDWSNKLKKLWFKEKKLIRVQPKVCPICKKEFRPKQSRTKYCSVVCVSFSQRRVERPDKETLHKLLWEKPTVHIAKDFNVSDKAVKKWAKTQNIDYPPRGYWQKKYKFNLGD